MRAQVLNHYYGITLLALVSAIIRNCISILALFLIGAPVIAQPKFKVFDAELGLSNNSITSIAQDQTGRLWIGTESGLNLFDGNSCKVFWYSSNDKNSIAGNYITCLAVDKFNRVWSGHDSGITCYDPSLHKFTRYGVGSANRISFISFDKYNRVWVGVHSKGLVVINPETGAVERRIDLTSFMEEKYDGDINRYNTINGMVEDSLGNMWLATYDGLYVFDRKLNAVKPLRVPEDTPDKPRYKYLKGIIEDKNGGFWLTSQWGHVSHYSPKQNLFSVHQTAWKEYGPFSYQVNDLVWRNEIELWFTTTNKQKPIGIFNIQTNTFSYLKLTDIFGSKIVATDLLFTDLFADHGGVIWAASDKGLVMINPKRHWDFNVTYRGDSATAITNIVYDTTLRKIFLATYYGPDLIVSSLIDNRTHSFGESVNPYNNSLLDTGGDSIWVISRNNIRLFDKVEEKWIDLPELRKLESHLGSDNQGFFKMIRASSGNYWIATLNNGVYMLDGSDLHFVNYKHNANDENSICSNFIVKLLEDKFGRIWFASRNAGISILNPTDNNFKKLNSEKNRSLFLPTNSIYDMAIDKEGNIWLATFEVGVIKIQIVSKDSLNTVTFDQDLLKGSPDQIEIDNQDRVWFTSADGVNVLDPKTMIIKSFEKSKGFSDSNFSLLLTNGRVFVNGSMGFGLIDETDLLPDTTLSPLVINSVTVFGEQIYPEGANNDRIELPYDHNSFVIDFAAVDFMYASKIKYSYKLEGLNSNEWSAPSSNRSTEFANLAGGDYVFKLKASNQEGIWSTEKDLLFIHVETPFWKTNWFYALIALVCTGITLALYYYQLNRNKRISQLQLKALHTQMRPHFIFNCLSAINSHIIKFETVKASEFLSQFSRLMRGILENSTESWITIEQEIETLRLYLVMEGLRFDDRLSYNIEVEEGINPSKTLIPSMILQPYVENAIGHGLLHKQHGTGIVTIKFLRGEGNLKCIIEDNGIGRERASQIKKKSLTSRKSLGLQITSERLQLLQGKSLPDIQDLKNEMGEPTGTRIVVMLMTKKVEDKDLVSVN